MNIFIDESGSFVAGNKNNLWNCVAAYMVPEAGEQKYFGALSELKQRSGLRREKEVKLIQVGENNWFIRQTSTWRLFGFEK